MFINFDAGKNDREPGSDGDCQVRALSSARCISYPDAWELLYLTQGELRDTGFALVRCLDNKDPRFGVIEAISFPAVKGKSRMTAKQFWGKYPEGNYILQMAHHVAAVCDGNLLDKWDSSSKCVYRAWRIEK